MNFKASFELVRLLYFIPIFVLINFLTINFSQGEEECDYMIKSLEMDAVGDCDQYLSIPERKG
jgi:hypothetical protein